MHSIVARQFPPHEISAIEGRLGQTRRPSLGSLRQTKIFIGHIHYGFHQHLQGASTYVTILREPVSRVLSLYRYIATNPQHYLHEQVADRSLIDFVSSQVDTEEVENGQTRQIAGVTQGSPNGASLLRAKQNLAEAFAAVGLVERFDESLILFKRRLGWKMPFYVRKNVTRRSLEEEATNEAREIISSRNTLDVELYEFGRELFQEHVRREGPLFEVEVSMFQTLNAAARVYRDVREWTCHVGGKGARNA
jgi:Galactose-3-O-sulfotransferase